MSLQLRNSALEQSFPFPTIFIIRIQATARTYLVRRILFSKRTPSRLSQLSSPPSLQNLAKQARYARAEASLRSALLKSESEPSPLKLQIRIMQNGLSAWNARVILGQKRIQNAEKAMVALQTGDQSPAFARVNLNELQKEKWMGIKERDEALEMTKKIKELIEELDRELQSGSKRSSLTPALRHDAPMVSDPEPSSPKARLLFSGSLPWNYLERLPRTRHSVEPLRLPLKHQESRRRASSLSSPPKTVPDSPLSSSSSSACSTSAEDDVFGAVLIYAPDRHQTHDKDGLQRNSKDHFRLPSYVNTLLDELSEDRLGSPKFEVSNEISRVVSVPATPASQKAIPPRTYQTPSTPTPKPKHRGILRPRLSNSSISRSKDKPEPSTPRSTTETFVDLPTPSTPRKRLSKIESVMNSVKKSVKKVSSKLVDS